MNHAILIKPKTISQTFFTMSFTAPSFQFEFNYYPAILMSTSSGQKGVFNWTNGASSTVNTLKGALGSFHPTQMMLTKKLHSYGKFHHNYELIIKHNVENGVGQHNIYFVFFLQGRDDVPDNALDLFLQKKTTIFDAATFLNNSFAERSNNIYYTVAKTKDHVFVFPKMILVKNEILRNITGSPKPASQIYREILLSEHVSESNRIPIEYDKEQIIEPISLDIQVIPLIKLKEGFETITQTCYPVDDSGETYAQVVIGSGTYSDGDEKAVAALEDTQMMFAYSILSVIMIVFIGGVTNITAAYATSKNNNWIKGLLVFFAVSFFAVGVSIPIAKLANRKKDGKNNMLISMASANFIGFFFLFSAMIMGIAVLPFKFKKPTLLYDFGDIVIDDSDKVHTFFSIFFPYLNWYAAPAAPPAAPP